MTKKIIKYILAVMSIPFGLIVGVFAGVIMFFVSIFEVAQSLFDRILYGEQTKIIHFSQLDDGTYCVKDYKNNTRIMTEKQFQEYVNNIEKKGGKVYGKSKKEE